MDTKSLIGFIIIFALLYVWITNTAPSQEELAEQQRVKDSIAAAQADLNTEADSLAPSTIGISDSLSSDSSFAEANSIQSDIPEKTFTLENDKLKITFSNKGGRITGVRLKGYQAVEAGKGDAGVKSPLYLMRDTRNKWNYIIPQGPGKSPVRTSQLTFKAEQDGQRIKFTAALPNGGTFAQVYDLSDAYLLDYDIQFTDAGGLSRGNTVQFLWQNYLPSLEKSRSYEKYYTTIYYKENEEDPTYLSASRSDEQSLKSPIKWFSFSNQFFNSTLIGESSFPSSEFTVEPAPEGDSSLVYATAEVSFKIENPASERFDMQLYVGPNDFDRLTTLGNDISDIVPFGWSIFGTINRWVIRPLFNFLYGLVGNMGLAIIILTVFVKLCLYPLTYKMLKSQTMMAGLKPQIQKIKDKFKDDQQATQMETMKLYREYGVSPLGGCLPMVIQMPIWFALYRFFPASIEFRQASFLWANDLSSYDVFFQLPFHIPFYGSHVSLFTLLWALSLLGYTHYNMKLNPAMNGAAAGAGGANMKLMRYMQYLMPVMFLFFLNSYAAGLTCYLLFSNLTNITQTVVTKEFILHDDKIQKKLARNKEKKKNKPKSKWQQRLEDVMKEQQDKRNKN